MTQPPVTVISVDRRHGQTEIMIVNIIDKLECYPALYYADWIHTGPEVSCEITLDISLPVHYSHNTLILFEWLRGLIMIESLF